MNDVSIIISNYNYGNFIKSAIDSAITQKYPCDIVIVDDGSSDDSVEIIKGNIKNLKLISYEVHNCNHSYYKGPMEEYNYLLNNDKNLKLIIIQNSGASTARNVGIWSAWDNSDFFAILDADDFMSFEKIDKMIKIITEYDEIGVVYGDYIIVRDGYNKVEFKQSYSQDRLQQECIVHSGALIRKEYLAQVVLPNDEFYDSKLHGPGSQEFIGCTEDYDLWLRLSKVCVMSHIPENLSVVRELGHNQSLKMNNEIFRRNIQIMQSR